MDWRSIRSESCKVMSNLRTTLLYNFLEFNPFISRSNMEIAPVLDDVDTSYQPVMFNGSFMKENAFRLKAGPEVDEAWGSLGVHCKYSRYQLNQAKAHCEPIDRSFALPAKEAEKSGLTSAHVQINEKYGGGFPVNLEGLHHLHCLNLVRQSLYYNYDYYHSQGKGAFVNEDNIVQYHVCK